MVRVKEWLADESSRHTVFICWAAEGANLWLELNSLLISAVRREGGPACTKVNVLCNADEMVIIIISA